MNLLRHLGKYNKVGNYNNLIIGLMLEILETLILRACECVEI
jgi:hypothetical protein